MTTANVSVAHIKTFLTNFEILNRNQKLKEVLSSRHYHIASSLYDKLYYSVLENIDIVQTVQVELQALTGIRLVINADPLLLINF